MSKKHFFSDTQGLVVCALDSLVSRNSDFLGLDKANKVVFSKTHDPSQVSIISGGGSGHEPAWSGYVGDGMLAAAVCGDIFASPATKQIMAAIKRVASDAGVILAVTNYTGDNLHFGLAREKALGMGYQVGIMPATDDVALGREKSAALGRRGLAGNIISLKLVGAAAQKSWSFEQCLELGKQANDQLVTVGSSLDHCHVPGRTHHDPIAEDACELGMGIHNEPGARTLSPLPTAEELTNEMLEYLLDSNDHDRGFVKFEPGDDVVMLIDNFGGVSNLELEAMTGIARTQLENDWSISPCRTYTGSFETSLNGPGYSITLCNVSGIAKAMQMRSADLLTFLDEPTAAPAWPKTCVAHVSSSKVAASANQQSASEVTGDKAAVERSPKVEPQLLDRTIRQACNSAISAEPDLTKWDTRMGDGDCGEAVSAICSALLTRLDSGLCASGSLFAALDAASEAIEDVGGSLAAILAILLAAFYTNLRRAFVQDEEGFVLDTQTLASCLGGAMRNLMQYTPARVGDRTVMDALIPFVEALEGNGDLTKAVEEAERGAKETAGMKAKYGRATYVGEREGQGETPPDPGAWAAAVFLRGLSEG